MQEANVRAGQERPIWVTGAGGLIGAEVVRQAGERVSGRRVIPLVRADLDLLDAEAVARRFGEDRPGVVVHCAGLTRGPQCEARPDLAAALNVDLTRRLVDLAGDDAVLVFFSTDLIFDGKKGWYTEEEEPCPRGVYAESKRAGERVALSHPAHLVVRTTLAYGSSPTGDRSFNEEMVKAARAGKRLRLFVDEFRTPIPVVAIARATCDLLVGLVASARPSDPSPVSRPSGVYHLAGTERLSRWEIGELLAGLHPELRGALEPSSIRDYDGPPRPADSSMRCERIRPWLSHPLPGFRTWVEARVRRARGEGGAEAIE